MAEIINFQDQKNKRGGVLTSDQEELVKHLREFALRVTEAIEKKNTKNPQEQWNILLQTDILEYISSLTTIELVEFKAIEYLFELYFYSIEMDFSELPTGTTITETERCFLWYILGVWRYIKPGSFSESMHTDYIFAAERGYDDLITRSSNTSDTEFYRFSRIHVQKIWKILYMRHKEFSLPDLSIVTD